jgi:hypothetical protein
VVRWRCPQEGTPRDSSPVCSPSIDVASLSYLRLPLIYLIQLVMKSINVYKTTRKKSKIRKLKKKLTTKLQLGPIGLSLQVQLTAVGLDGWVPLLSTCHVEFAVWVYRWVEFIAWVGLDLPQLGFGICRGWVGLSTLGWICCCRIGFAVIGHDSSLLGTIRRHWVAFALAALNSPVLAPLAEIGCVGFAIIDPTCRRWVQSIAVGLVGCDCDRFSLARAEELSEIEGKDDRTKNRS